jgi:hypothetical protein
LSDTPAEELLAYRESVEKHKKRKEQRRHTSAENNEEEDDEEADPSPMMKTIMPTPIGAFQMLGSQSKLGEAEDEDALEFPNKEEEQTDDGLLGPGKLPDSLVVTSARVVTDYDNIKEGDAPKKNVLLVQAKIMEEKTQEPAPAVNFQDKQVRGIICCVLVGVIILVVALSVTLSGGNLGGGSGNGAERNNTRRQ